MKRHYGKFLITASALVAISLLAQSPSPTPLYSGQAELSKVEEWVLSQGTVESIAPELAAILGLGSDRLPVKLRSFRTKDAVSPPFAVTTNTSQKAIVITALKTIQAKMTSNSIGTDW